MLGRERLDAIVGIEADAAKGGFPCIWQMYEDDIELVA